MTFQSLCMALFAAGARRGPPGSAVAATPFLELRWRGSRGNCRTLP